MWVAVVLPTPRCLGVVFLQVSACSGSLLRQELREKVQQGISQNDAQIHPNFMKNPSKIFQNQPKRWPGVPQARSWKRCGFRNGKNDHHLLHFLPFWRHLGDFGRHFGPQRIPKGVQKSYFLAQINIKCRQMRSRKASRKNMIFGWIFDEHLSRLDLQYLAPA